LPVATNAIEVNMAIAADHRGHAVVRVLRIAGVLLAAITTASCADLFYGQPPQSIVKTQKNSKSAGARKNTLSIAAEFAANWPIADPADQTAFERYRSERRPEIYGGSG
jgi:hypothetical protein